mgnify:FL=1
MRPRMSWEEYFSGIAQAVAARAACPRASVGAVLVSQDDHRILSTGYNGAPAGQPDCMSHGCLMEDNHCQRALHAEVNAIAYAARHGISVKGSKLYLSGKDKPCRECMKVIVAAGVIWNNEEYLYRSC